MLSPDELRQAFATQQKIPLLGTDWTIVDMVQVYDLIHGPLLRLRLHAQPDAQGLYLDGLIRITLRERKPETTREEHLAKCKGWAAEAVHHLPPGVVVSQLINGLSHHDATYDHEAIARAREMLMQGKLESRSDVEAFVEGI